MSKCRSQPRETYRPNAPAELSTRPLWSWLHEKLRSPSLSVTFTYRCSLSPELHRALGSPWPAPTFPEWLTARQRSRENYGALKDPRKRFHTKKREGREWDSKSVLTQWDSAGQDQDQERQKPQENWKKWLSSASPSSSCCPSSSPPTQLSDWSGLQIFPRAGRS